MDLLKQLEEANNNLTNKKEKTKVKVSKDVKKVKVSKPKPMQETKKNPTLINKKEIVKNFKKEDLSNSNFQTRKIEKINKQKSIRIPSELNAFINEFAQRKNISKNNLIREILLPNINKMSDKNFLFALLEQDEFAKQKNDLDLNLRFTETDLEKIESMLNQTNLLNFSKFVKISLIHFYNSNQ